jgi:hypothetical protein
VAQDFATVHNISMIHAEFPKTMLNTSAHGFFEGPQDATKYAPWSKYSKYGICFIVIHTI